MATGDDALSAGMALVNGATANSAAAIDDYINATRDYVANGHVNWKTGIATPVAHGGTGATTASTARTNLDVFSKANTVNTNGTYNIEIQSPDGNTIQVFINGVFKFALP